MKRTFKKYFVPHEANDHKPHALRPKVLGFIAAAVLAFEAVFLLNQLSLLPSTGFLASVISSVLVDETNELRVDNDLAVLTPSPVLKAAAQAKANDMAANGYFSHDAPDGKTPWYWFKQAGYAYRNAGENLAINFTDSDDVTRAWMRSPAHKANIVNGSFTEIGIATAEGEYQGKQTTFVVQLFGTPLAAATPPAQAPAPQPVAASAPAETPAPKPTPPSQTPAAPVRTPTPRPAPREIVSPEQTFVAVEVTEAESGTVALAQPESRLVDVAQASTLEQAAASPTRTARDVFLVLGAIVAFALLLKLVYGAARHPHQYAHGAGVIVLILGALALNTYLSLHDAQVLGEAGEIPVSAGR